MKIILNKGDIITERRDIKWSKRKNQKSKINNQWAGSNTVITDKSGEKEKNATNNQWTSTNKKARKDSY